MVFVVDEYGTLEGIVTPTDILEAIAGDIADDNPEPSVVARQDGSLLIDGMMPAEEIFGRLTIPETVTRDDYTTLAGFVIFRLGRIPTAGDAFEAHGWRFEVVDMDSRRVDKVLATPLAN